MNSQVTLTRLTLRFTRGKFTRYIKHIHTAIIKLTFTDNKAPAINTCLSTRVLVYYVGILTLCQLVEIFIILYLLINRFNTKLLHFFQFVNCFLSYCQAYE